MTSGPCCLSTGLTSKLQILAVAIGTTTAAFIAPTATAITPHRIAQVQVTGVGGRSDNTAGNSACSGAHGRVTSKGTDRSTARSTDHGATGRAVTGGGTATGDQQGRRKSHYQCRAHVWLPFCYDRKTPNGTGWFLGRVAGAACTSKSAQYRFFHVIRARCPGPPGGIAHGAGLTFAALVMPAPERQSLADPNHQTAQAP